MSVYLNASATNAHMLTARVEFRQDDGCLAVDQSVALF